MKKLTQYDIELLHVDEIGDKIAESLLIYFADDRNRAVLEALVAAGLQFTMADSTADGGSQVLDGKSFVVSGVFTAFSRDEIKDMIEKHGGRNVGSISAKTDYVLAGENMGPSKLKKAESLGVPIISEDDFLAMIG